MGRTRNVRNRATKNKQYRKKHSTKRRARDIDQIQDDLAKELSNGAKTSFEADEDLPGLGQFYCTPCARHFVNLEALLKHEISKVHKRRCFLQLKNAIFLMKSFYRLKDVAQEQYTQKEAELAAGKSTELLPPAHPEADQMVAI
jgi:hypothetical protein